MLIAVHHPPPPPHAIPLLRIHHIERHVIPEVQFSNDGGGWGAPFDGFHSGCGVDSNVLWLFHSGPKWHL
jgi:hypothetical protein